MSDNTAVDKRDLPADRKPIHHNAPADMEQAIARIMELEMRLEDLVRATEIAEASAQWHIIGGFRLDADSALKNKITVEYPQSDEPNITVVTGEVSDVTQQRLNQAITEQAKKAAGIA
jgi:hypothetical protein